MAVSYKEVEKKYKAKNAAIDKSVAAQGNAYDAQRQNVADNTQRTLQDIYIQNERAKQTQGQAMKAAGVTGGAAESAAVAQAANYNTNRTNAMLERDRQLSDIYIQQEQSKAQGEINKAQNNLEMETGRLSFEQAEDQKLREDTWRLVDAGIINDKNAEALGRKKETLQKYYDNKLNIQKQSEYWDMVKAGVINDSIAKALNHDIKTLREYYKRIQEAKA